MPDARHEHPPARLLVVDDIEMNRDLLVRRARRLGHESGVAEDGVAALEQLRAAAWDLVLLDITMPRMDGYETLRQIKADPALSHVPVIMVSAIDEVDSVVRCLEMGADDYVTKPFNAVILQARIEAALAKKRLADQRQAVLRALEREMEIGHRIQRGFLPAVLPTVPGWSLAAHCEPARQVGGDFYDVVPLPDGRLALVIADICDKGVGAALYMALFRTLLRVLLVRDAHARGAGELLVEATGTVNDYIAREHGRDNMFATVFAAVLDPATGRLDYVNLGHDAPMLHRVGAPLRRLEPGAPACGLMDGLRGVPGRVDLSSGDCLLMFTDGATDAGEQTDAGLSEGGTSAFGEARLAQLLHEHAAADAPRLIDAIAAAVRAHAAGRPAHDDLTLLSLKYEGSRTG